MGDEKSASQSTMKLGLWLTFIAFLLIVAVFHSKISEITFGEKGVSAKMMSPQDTNKFSAQERQNAQQALSQRVSTLEEQAKSQPQSTHTGDAQEPQSQLTNATYQATIPNIAGYWGAVDGSAYMITQNGNYVVFQGYSNGVLSVAGNGQISGSDLTLQTTNLAYRAGTLSLQISQDLRQLNGTYTDVMTNQSFPIQIYR